MIEYNCETSGLQILTAGLFRMLKDNILRNNKRYSLLWLPYGYLVP